jgi:hypothetical protein
MPNQPVVFKNVWDFLESRNYSYVKKDWQKVNMVAEGIINGKVVCKMKGGKAIIALAGTEFAGFCYIESWGNKEYVANSGLIVVEKFRGHGLAKRIKNAAFTLSRLRWPKAKLFGLTSGAAVMKIRYIDFQQIEQATRTGLLNHPAIDTGDRGRHTAGCGRRQGSRALQLDLHQLIQIQLQ